MTSETTRRPSIIHAVLLGQALAAAMLLGCLWWVTQQIAFVFESHRILLSVGSEQQLGPAVIRELARFAVAAWFVHALLGFAAVGLALLTEKAFPAGIRARLGWLVAGWFMLLAALVLAANTTFHPASVFAGEASWWRIRQYGFLPIQIALGATALLVAALLLRAAPGSSPRGRAGVIATFAVLTAGAFLLASPPRLHTSPASGGNDKPSIILLGLDSLRNDLLVPRRGAADTPSIRAFLAESVRFMDASTPLARTYPSWLSTLTGRHPTVTNARFNLMARDLVRPGDTLGDALRAHGYRAIYATDEVRFANIDRSFGFDQVITPPVGAADFLLGYGGDLPLVNLAARTAAGNWLFPANHANRGAAITYEPQQFLDRLDRGLAVDGPTFLALHLTLAHWPYAWAGMEIPTVPEAYRDDYALAVAAVDRQFATALEILRGKRLLDNAIVVVFSDHGEALGAENDSLLRNVGSGAEIWNSLWGHGTSVLSPNQYHTLLAMRAYGRASLPVAAGRLDWPVSLEDLRPTLEELATGRAPAPMDGRSLVPYLNGMRDPAELATRVRFTETDFNTPATKAGRFAASGVFQEAASFYELDRDSGWVQLRANRMPELLAQKERAAFTSNKLLAALPGPSGQPTRYLISDRRQANPKPLGGPPDPRTEPEARLLWDALHARFPGELTGPATVR